jgi:two-component system response regulator ResD
MKREKRILVVDDDDSIRALLFTILRRRGHAVDTARNGAEALERIARCHYAVMLLDLMMPTMSGWEVIRHLESAPADRVPIVIVLTAGNEPRNLNPKIISGTVRKPFEINLLTDTITACLDSIQEREQADECPPAVSETGSESFEKVN